MNKRVLLLAAAGVAAGLVVRRTVRGKRNLDIAALGVRPQQLAPGRLQR